MPCVRSYVSLLFCDSLILILLYTYYYLRAMNKLMYKMLIYNFLRSETSNILFVVKSLSSSHFFEALHCSI